MNYTTCRKIQSMRELIQFFKYTKGFSFAEPFAYQVALFPLIKISFHDSFSHSYFLQ